MTQYASIETKSAAIASDFGRDYAMKVFGLTLAELEAIVGRYTKGKRKGELRFELQWRKVATGGWMRRGPGECNGGVMRPGLRFGHQIVDVWTRNARGENTVLWSDDFKRFGWIPGETREQYDARQKVRREWLDGRQTRAQKKAAALVAKMSDRDLCAKLAKCGARGGHFKSFTLAFVAVAIEGELNERCKREAEEMRQLGAKMKAEIGA